MIVDQMFVCGVIKYLKSSYRTHLPWLDAMHDGLVLLQDIQHFSAILEYFNVEHVFRKTNSFLPID